jgi:hypothetical protein
LVWPRRAEKEEIIMSTYINFFVKDKNSETFIPLGEYSRNSIYFRMFEAYAPWEKVKKIDNNRLDMAKKECAEAIEHLINEKDKITEKKYFVSKLKLPLNEILEEYNELVDEYDTLEEERKSYTAALYKLLTFEDVNSYEDNELYVGIECYEPTKEDIE